MKSRLMTKRELWDMLVRAAERALDIGYDWEDHHIHRSMSVVPHLTPEALSDARIMADAYRAAAARIDELIDEATVDGADKTSAPTGMGVLVAAYSSGEITLDELCDALNDPHYPTKTNGGVDYCSGGFPHGPWHLPTEFEEEPKTDPMGAPAPPTPKVSKDTGFNCSRCNERNEYAEANQPDGTYLCYGCR